MNKNLDKLIEAFDEIQMPRTPYQLENMVINSEDTIEMQYAHCVLELQVAYDNLRMAKSKARLKEIEIEEITENDEKHILEKEIKSIELEQLNRARLGALREFESLYVLWEKFPIKYSRNQINEGQKEYWSKRLERQAYQDKMATGRISQGNQDALRQIGKSITPQFDVVRDVEKRYLEEGKTRILITVPTIDQAINGLACLKGITMPTECEYKIFNVYGRSIDDAYNVAVQQAIQDNADYLVTVEDDTFPQKDAIVKLLNLARKNTDCAIGAWYPKRSHPRQGVHIIQKDGHREFLDDDGETHDVYTLAMGCTIYPISMFLETQYPWFSTTANLTQDSFFSQLARDAGYGLLVDTNIKCKHIDRITNEVFE